MYSKKFGMLQETSGESDWAGVELEEFMQCEHNMAVNRQTRMLADLGTANFREMIPVPYR